MKHTFTFLTALLLALLMTLVAGAAAWAADVPSWPRFHGPKFDNISRDTGLLTQWPEDGPTLAWTAQGIGAGFAGVTLADGLIFTAGNINDATTITALDLDGKIVWQVENGKAWTGAPDGNRGTPTIDGDRLYHESPSGNVVCLEAKTGKKVWGVNILETFGSRPPTWGLSESVLIDGNNLICLPAGPKTAVVALDKMTGKTVWQSASADGDVAGYASAVLAEHQGLRMVLTMTSAALIGVNADKGELLFRYPHKTAYDENATSPIFHDGQIFITSGCGTTGSVMLKLSISGQKASVEKVWASRELDNHHGSVILMDGYIYGASDNFNNRKWVCLDWKTGEKKYAERGVGKGSLTAAEGMLYTWSEKRNVGLVKATPDGHNVISKFDIPRPNDPESMQWAHVTWAHPVVCGGRLYLRYGDNLYAYDVKKK